MKAISFERPLPVTDPANFIDVTLEVPRPVRAICWWR
jgi:hypothetical protein